MTIYRWSALSNGQTINFDPAKDQHGDHLADFEIALSGVTTLTATDFVL